MTDQFLSSTPRGQLEALAYQGILATNSHAQLSALLESRLSRAHALVLAEPMHDDGRQVVDWYTAAPGLKKSLESLPPEAQNAALGRLNELLADMRGLASELLKSPDAAKNVRGQILSLALQYPGNDQVYVVGEQPVVTCWGCATAARGVEAGEVSRLGAAVPPPATAPSGRSWWWLKLLAFLLLIYCLAALLLGPPFCLWPLPESLARLPGFQACPGPEEPLTEIPAPELTPSQGEELKAAQDEEARLREEYEELRKKLDELAAQCKPPESVPPEPEPCDLCEPAPEPDDGLKLPPEEERQNNDFSFLDGCWICDSGLINDRTKKPIVMEFCFDAQGRGDMTIQDPDLGACRGKTRASFQDKNLKIKIDHAKCADKKNAYSSGVVKCTEQDGDALCFWYKNEKSKKPLWNSEAVFRRKK